MTRAPPGLDAPSPGAYQALVRTLCSKEVFLHTNSLELVALVVGESRGR